MGTHKAAFWIKSLGLIAHPEGGYYREIYRSDETISREALQPRFNGPRSLCSLIYFLLPNPEISKLHRLLSDEIWHFYFGDPLTIHIIDSQNRYRTVTLGKLSACDSFVAIVKRGWWFAATVEKDNGFSLVGCTVTPGFDFADFELANANELIAMYPDYRPIIERLT